MNILQKKPHWKLSTLNFNHTFASNGSQLQIFSVNKVQFICVNFENNFIEKFSHSREITTFLVENTTINATQY